MVAGRAAEADYRADDPGAATAPRWHAWMPEQARAGASVCGGGPGPEKGSRGRWPNIGKWWWEVFGGTNLWSDDSKSEVGRWNPRQPCPNLAVRISDCLWRGLRIPLLSESRRTGGFSAERAGPDHLAGRVRRDREVIAPRLDLTLRQIWPTGSGGTWGGAGRWLVVVDCVGAVAPTVPLDTRMEPTLTSFRAGHLPRCPIRPCRPTGRGGSDCGVEVLLPSVVDQWPLTDAAGSLPIAT
ncbi:hypothetical protein FrEUN1fDRAFT_2565 [Parafrankia sp. EUN1f]|nr:hypothetical protein FrEUN1fDRAFT_2565 [Parafrankia sp. EUN1f]